MLLLLLLLLLFKHAPHCYYSSCVRACVRARIADTTLLRLRLCLRLRLLRTRLPHPLSRAPARAAAACTSFTMRS
jgi:hypothetical protein